MGNNNKITVFKGEWKYLSNFSPCKIEVLGHIFYSVENAYQAHKCGYIRDRKKFVSISPSEAKRLGNTVPRLNDWDKMKVRVMEHLLRQKFREPIYKELLLETGDALIEEGNYHWDRFWGICPPDSGIGENMLGKLLMKIRDELVEDERKADQDLMVKRPCR